MDQMYYPMSQMKKLSLTEVRGSRPHNQVSSKAGTRTQDWWARHFSLSTVPHQGLTIPLIKYILRALVSCVKLKGRLNSTQFRRTPKYSDEDVIVLHKAHMGAIGDTWDVLNPAQEWRIMAVLKV